MRTRNTCFLLAGGAALTLVVVACADEPGSAVTVPMSAAPVAGPISTMGSSDDPIVTIDLPASRDAERIEQFQEDHKDDSEFGGAWIEIQPHGYTSVIRVLPRFSGELVEDLEATLEGDLLILRGGASLGELIRLQEVAREYLPEGTYSIDRATGTLRIYPPATEAPAEIADSKYVVVESTMPSVGPG